MVNKTRYTLKTCNGDLVLYENEEGMFAVRYGLMLTTGLSLSKAATELGHCLMHAILFDGVKRGDE